MKRLIQIGPRCMVYATAMLFDCTPEDVTSFLGHDGTLDNGLRGIHIQEIQAFALSRGHCLALYEFRPVLGTVEVDVWKEDYMFMHNTEGLILGENASGGKHCVAWDGESIFDPREPSDFKIMQQFWAKKRF